MKKLIVFGFSLAAITLQAQDVIYFTNGSQQGAKVLDVGSPNVVYKKTENPDGPTYLAAKNEVNMIIYANGTRDIMANSTYTQVQPQTQTQNPQYSVPGPVSVRPRVNIVVAPPVRYYGSAPVCRASMPVYRNSYHHHSNHRGHRF